MGLLDLLEEIVVSVIVHPDGTVEPAIRKLSEDETNIFAGAVVRAYIILPAFRDAIALMRPFYDATADTAYTDPYSRVGLSPWFFNELDVYQRASVILHEAFHVLNNTFTRGAALNADGNLANIASDLEINCSLHKLPEVDLSFGILPNRKPFDFELYKTMEQYYHLINDDPDLKDQLTQNNSDPDCPKHGKGEPGSGGQGAADNGPSSEGSEGQHGEPGSGSSGGQEDQGGDEGSGADGEQSGEQAGDPSDDHSHGNSGPQCTCPHDEGSDGGPGTTSGCDVSNDERVSGADAADVERASEAEQSIAKGNTAVRMEEALKQARSIGKADMQEFLALALQNMKPPQVDWRKLFSRVVSQMQEAITRGRTDYSYRRTSRRFSDSAYIFPGMVTYQPKMMYGVDTSGSMSHDDHLRIAQEVEGILKATSRAKDALRMFSIDTTVKNCKLVNNVKQLDLRGGGGTAMEVGWEFVRNLPAKERPNIFILGTDGYTDWNAVENEVILTKKMFKSIILVTTKGGFDSVPETLHRLCPIFDISDGEAAKW